MPDIRITIACPVAHLSDASQFSRATGYGPEDEATFLLTPEYEDASGERYRVASGLVAEAYLSNAVSPLPEPAWGADMDAAARAQALIAVWVPPEESEDDNRPPFAAQDRIAVVIGDDPAFALSAFGLTRIVQEGDPEPASA